MAIIIYILIIGLTFLGFRYIKNSFGRFILFIIMFISLILWVVGMDYPKYQDLAKNGKITKCKIIDYEEKMRIKNGREIIDNLYTFVCDEKEIRRINRPSREYQIGDKLKVFYVKNGDGCLVGTEKQSPIKLAIFGISNGSCFRIREDLEKNYINKL